MSEFLSILEDRVIPVVARNASSVDAEARFPSQSIEALRESGLLGLISRIEVGGRAGSVKDAASIIERLARECASTAMVTAMHYAATAVLEAHGSEAIRKDVAAGRHFTTLAFSESGSRSMFWAPTSTARTEGSDVVLDAKKSWVTSAHYADSYVWSSRPVAGDGASTIWLVPRESNGLSIVGKFTGLGLRGNDSTPVVAESVRIPASNRLGEDGGGFGVMMVAVLPIFNLLNASCSIGVMEGALARTIEHANKTKFEHTGQSIAEQPTARQHLARARIKADMARTLVFDTADSLVAARPDAMLRVLECKACAADTATEVLGLLMRVAGGAAYRADVGVERYFRDAQAATVMAPTTDALHDFIGKAICGLDLF